MKFTKLLSLWIAVFALLATTSWGQGGIMTAKQFMELYKANDDLVIIDANTPKGYKVAHIKKAIHVNHSDLYQGGDIPNLLLTPSQLAAYFGSKGVSANSKIVIYDEGSQKAASRLYHILEYIGATDVNILHKNLNAWRKARIPLTSAPTELAAATFNAKAKNQLLATTDYVAANKDVADVMVLDLRTPLEYKGAINSKGHIPGAVNLNHSRLLTKSGAFKPKAELEAIAAELGLTPDQELIFSCRTGIRASVGYVAFKDILGYDKVRVYDGSYIEWINSDKDLLK